MNTKCDFRTNAGLLLFVAVGALALMMYYRFLNSRLIKSNNGRRLYVL